MSISRKTQTEFIKKHSEYVQVLNNPHSTEADRKKAKDALDEISNKVKEEDTSEQVDN